MGAESTLCFHSLIPILAPIVLRVVVVTVTGGPLGQHWRTEALHEALCSR